MRNTDFLKGKGVLIVGLARSGASCARLLSGLGARVRVTDNQDNASTRNNAQGLFALGIKLELGRHSREFLEGVTMVVVSPGVPNDSLPVLLAREKNIPVVSEIELSWQLCPSTVIAITGTNGKTTVTTLVGRIIEGCGRKVFVCGNIGTPFSSQVDRMETGDFVSLEVSSFQLENIDRFRPKVSAILNLSANHLDRYGDMAEYLQAKKNIFRNQDSSDFLVLNSNDPQVSGLGKECRAKTLYFDSLSLNANYAAALTIASALGFDRGRAVEALRGFAGVEHRMEKVSEVKGVLFINDSKSTTTEATVWALKNISSPVILIAGGREKGNDYQVVARLAQDKVKLAFLIGESKERIRRAFADKVETDFASTLEEAVKKAFSAASPGDCVLFSPMCKSFDMFLNFEERGVFFKRAVTGLLEE